jgi:hypothetical protein
MQKKRKTQIQANRYNDDNKNYRRQFFNVHAGRDTGSNYYAVYVYKMFRTKLH